MEVVRRDRALAVREVDVLSKENVLALLLALMVIFLLIATTGSSPQWIYQGF